MHISNSQEYNEKYTPTGEEDKLIKLVETRWEQMKIARGRVDYNWSKYQDMIDAIFEPYNDERATSSVPLASSIIELFIAQSNKIPTEFMFRAETSKHSAGAKALEYVWKYDWRKQNRKKEIISNDYTTAGFGSSVMYTGFEAYTKVQKDVLIDDEYNITTEERDINIEKIILKDVDIRRFWIDNHAINDIEEANDCVYVEWEGFDKFQRLKDSPLYKNIDKVGTRNFDNEYESFTTQEEASREGTYVKKVYYWNLEKDVFCIIANGVVIKEHPILSTIGGVKALPFVFRILGKKTRSIYGRGFCEALMMFNSELNDLREMLMDAIRRSNSQVLAIGAGLEFNGREFVYDNEILTFDGQFANNFEQISGNPPNQAIFSYLDRLYKDIAVYIGIDINNIVGTPNKTAFEVEVQREASQERLNVYFLNRDLAYERLANLHKENLQKFFPRKNAEGIYPMIEIEDEEFDKKKEKFRAKKGKHIFEVTPEILSGDQDIYIDVHTNTTATTISAVDRQQKKEFLSDLSNVVQTYAEAKKMGVDLENILPMKENIRDVAEDHNITVESKEDDQEDVKEAKSKLLQDVQGMRTGSNPTPVEGNVDVPQEPQVPEEGSLPPSEMPQGAI